MSTFALLIYEVTFRIITERFATILIKFKIKICFIGERFKSSYILDAFLLDQWSVTIS